MKNKNTSNKQANKILFFICCVLLALIFWFVVQYDEIGDFPLTMWGDYI